jgi:hypothetical protein
MTKRTQYLEVRMANQYVAGAASTTLLLRRYGKSARHHVGE